MEPLAPRYRLEHYGDGLAPGILGFYLTLAAADTAMLVHRVDLRRKGLGGCLVLVDQAPDPEAPIAAVEVGPPLVRDGGASPSVSEPTGRDVD